MRKENILVIAIICIAVVGVMVFKNSDDANKIVFSPEKEIAQKSDTAKINWQGYEKGLELAKKKDKPVFLYFHADWCTYCVKLAETTFKAEAVLSYLKDNFISIAVDTDQNKALSKKWKIRGLPTVWFLKSDHSKINNLPGYADEEHFLNVLKYVHTQSYVSMSFDEFMKKI